MGRTFSGESGPLFTPLSFPPRKYLAQVVRGLIGVEQYIRPFFFAHLNFGRGVGFILRLSAFLTRKAHFAHRMASQETKRHDEVLSARDAIQEVCKVANRAQMVIVRVS